MVQPIIYQIPAFDSADEQTFKFTFSGNQAYKNRLVIRNNDTNTVVYDQTTETFQLKHTIPSGTLANGMGYNAQIQVYDRAGIESPWSNKILFYCFTTPSFQFSNITPNQIIQNASFEFQLSYSQPEGEALSEYRVFLCDSARQQIYSTGVLSPTEKMSVIINNLHDNFIYFIRATGVTRNKMEIDTGYVPVSVEYIRPGVFAVVNLENIPCEGLIKIESNIIAIEGKPNPDPPLYIDDKMVDLRGDGSWVLFDEGFDIENDFTLQMIGKGFRDYSPILEFTNRDSSIVVKYMRGNFAGQDQETAFFSLRAYNKLTCYYQETNYISLPSSSDLIHLWIRRKGYFYEMKAQVIS